MKDGQLIAADEARSLIATYGIGQTILDGAPVDALSPSEIEDGDSFKVVINYGHPVQLHLIDGDLRCAFELAGLKGYVEDGEWVASA